MPRPVPRPAPPRTRDRGAQGGLARRAGAFIVTLPDHSLLDRVVRGRAWIPLLGVLLAGIVAAQVEILKLGATMGRALEQTSSLTMQNEQLRGSVAALADDQRIERLAANMGMVLPPPGAVGYLPAKRGGDVSGALGNLHSPDAAGFVALAPKNGALITGPGTSTLPPSPGAPPPPATTTTGTVTSSAITTPQTTTASSQTTATTTATTTSSTPTTSQSTASGATVAAAQSSTQTLPQQTATAPSGSPTGAAAIQPTTSSQTTSGG